MFGKPYELTLNRIHDTVRISENGDHIDLTVSTDAMKMVAALTQAQKRLERYDDAPYDAARAFAEAIFGEAQAEKLLAFYGGDAGCVVSVCGQYFKERLGKKLVAAQKRTK